MDGQTKTDNSTIVASFSVSSWVIWGLKSSSLRVQTECPYLFVNVGNNDQIILQETKIN